ncbi:MAG: N-acetyltransferase [Thermoanaerobaculia bacterium]
MQLFLARRGGESVGRIAAILDRHHNEKQREQTAFFGFFESENDPAVSGALFDAAALWARERRMRTLRGPLSPSLNDEAGLLVDGFGKPPVVMMTYNPPYYPALVEAAGFRKSKDLLAYWLDIRPKPLARLEKLAARVSKQLPEVRVRSITKRSLLRDLPKVQEVYNEAWEENWGFVPMTDEEMEFMAKRLKPLLDPDFVYLAEVPRPDGGLEPIAFVMALPDYNQALAPLRGRLLPFGWLKFLLASRRIPTLRILTLGIKRPYRMRGIHSVVFAACLRAALRRGFTGCEVSWLLEDNELVIRAVDLWEGYLYKTYRLYEREL